MFLKWFAPTPYLAPMQTYGQKASKIPPHLWPPKIFFQKSGSVTFVPLWCSNFMQKIRKTNERSPRYSKMDGPTDHGQGRLLRTLSGKPGFQNISFHLFYIVKKVLISEIITNQRSGVRKFGHEKRKETLYISMDKALMFRWWIVTESSVVKIFQR